MAKTAALVGEKLGMTQVWDESNRIVPVTVLRVSPARVVQIRTPEKDGYSALQVTYGHRDARKLTKPLAGHYAKGDVDPGVRLVELRLDDISAYEVGQTLDADTFAAGDLIDVTAVSKGKGFAGAMKRHGFGGLRASHGVSISHRSHGSTGGRQDPGKTFKNKKMAGHLGTDRVTTQNLKVVQLDVERGLILVEGSVPGHRGGYIYVRDAVKRPAPADLPKPGKFKEPKAAAEAPAAAPAEENKEG